MLSNRMRYQNQSNAFDHSYRLPAFLILHNTVCQEDDLGIIEYLCRARKADAMLPQVDPVLFLVPFNRIISSQF